MSMDACGALRRSGHLDWEGIGIHELPFCIKGHKLDNSTTLRDFLGEITIWQKETQQQQQQQQSGPPVRKVNLRRELHNCLNF
ncbi:hypothetical protein E2C01_047642 [Portunus trituberculatus]|uniref:Uncharacterized protein n=1 Tax=Portunus trituberculatus TaxID=210409 RepID=A0A5B7G936_PORTR|nr:hypothetical protein [Portunus trituberculatus]